MSVCAGPPAEQLALPPIWGWHSEVSGVHGGSCPAGSVDDVKYEKSVLFFPPPHSCAHVTCNTLIYTTWSAINDSNVRTIRS
jgi:hypothetical protein